MKNPKKRHPIVLLASALGLMLVLMLQSQMTNPKVDNFLNSLSRYANADMARSALLNLRFTESERRLLEGGLRQPAYAPQVDRLAKTIKGPVPKPWAPQKEIPVLTQEQATRISGVNLQLNAEAKRLVAVSAQATSSAAMRAVTGNPPKITSLSQQTIEPGESLIIRGTALLPRGSVSFTFGSSVVEGQVTEWTNDLIFVQLPASVTGIAETDGSVTVWKQNRALRADAPIHFIPIWAYQVLQSDQMTYAGRPYNLAVALATFFFTGATQWCSQYNISFPTVPFHELRNTWAIHSHYYESDIDAIDVQGESATTFIGATTLPGRTVGQICFTINWEPKVFCVVTIKGPRGVAYK